MLDMRLCGTGATLLFWNSSSLVFYSFLSPQSNLGPQFPSGRGNARGHKDGRPGSHEDARPNLGGQMGTSRPIDECARRGRPGDSRKGAERFYHAKPRPHLARIFGQAREGPHEDALVGGYDYAPEDAKDVHAGTRRHADPAEEADADEEGRDGVGVDGAEVVAGQVAGNGPCGDAERVGDEQEAD